MYPFDTINIAAHGCLSGEEQDTCRLAAMTLVVMTNQHFVARYTSCKAIHAERFFAESKVFQQHILSQAPRSVHMFMKMHPCHYIRTSQGSLFPNGDDVHSCADIIVNLYKTHLEPKHIALTIHIASLYKTYPVTLSANKHNVEGLYLLLRAGIHVECFERHHWLQLANLCTKPVKIQHILSKERVRMDEFIRQFLNDIKNTIKEH